MDRSFLSVTPVVQASRRFVCIRNLTYEDAEERDFQRSLMVGFSGDVENTTFCFLSPDAKQKISYAGRSVRRFFQTADQMASWMNQAADYYDAERKRASLKPEPLTALPLVENVRLGLNTASADNVPLVVLYGKTPAELTHLKSAAADLAWKPEFMGRCAFTVAPAVADLAKVQGAASQTGLLVVQPEGWGLEGKVLARAGASANAEQLAEALRQGLKTFRPRLLNGFEYQRAGTEACVFWETKLPVTDQMEAQARERTRRHAAARGK